MPKITQTHEIDISPEKFLNACSANELQEVDLLIQSPRYQQKMGRTVTMNVNWEEVAREAKRRSGLPTLAPLTVHTSRGEMTQDEFNKLDPSTQRNIILTKFNDYY